MTIANNLLTQYRGTWSSSPATPYGFSPIKGTNQYASSMVTYGTPAALYFCNGSVQPTPATIPPSDSAWTLFSGSATPNLAPVLVATTANITLSGEQTIDGVLTSTSRVGVVNQTLSQNDGIYTTGAGAWTRVADLNTWASLVGAVFAVEQGTTQAGYIFASNAQPGGTINTTALTFNHVGTNEVITATYPLVITGANIAQTHTNGFIKGMSGSAIADATAITINGGSNVVTSNLTVNATSVSLPLNSSLIVTAVLDVTTSSASGATFTITGTNCTATTQAIAVGASVTNQYITLCAYVTTTGTASPNVSIKTSSLTGTVGFANDSFIMISQS